MLVTHAHRPQAALSRGLRAWPLALASALGGGPASGAEPKPARLCADAHYEAQMLRDDGKLVEARGRLVVCSQEACPRVVSRECAEWLAELDKAMPSIVLKAVDARGRDVFDVAVSENGEPFELRPDGKAVSIDPGQHWYRFEHGGQVVEERVLVREGEQRRVLLVTFDRVNAPVAAPPPPRPRRGRHLTPASLALGGAGLVALGAFAYFGLDGRGDYERLRDDCGRRCAPDDVERAGRTLLFADLSLGVGVASLAAAGVLFLTSADPPEGAPSRALRLPLLTPAPGGAVASFGGSF